LLDLCAFYEHPGQAFVVFGAMTMVMLALVVLAVMLFAL
jgi:hypothetical protein